ncbi:MAG: hypothetical protein JWN04_2409, partial [Myxococcaceae bacterium]|nr:hypothetical protein [Myxococcaceae bacterium]
MTARTWLVPQVLQSSLMDCGPASLKSVLSGFGREVSYDELRERCQTDVDGTSLSALAALGGEYGLTSREVLVKRDCLLLPASASLPAIVVTRAGGGNLHFVVVWRRWGPFVQIMDPGSGRKWLSTRRILEQLTDIPIALTATRWRRWAGAEHTRAIWKARMRQLGMRAAAIELQLGKALEDPTWRSLGTLDAALRMVHELVQRAAVRAGGEAQGLLHALSEVTAPGAEFARVPPQYWWVTPHAVEPGKLIVKGCVIVSFAQSTQCSARSGPTLAEHDAQAPERQPRSAAILPSGADFGPRAKHSPMKMLWQIARAEQSPRLFAAALALMACALVVPLEAVLLRGLLSLRPGTVLDYQLALGMCALLLLLSVAAWLDGFQAERVQQIGSALEAKLRVALLSKLPLLEDRYLRTRPVSDMASRAHALHHIQEIPTLWSQAARALLDLLAALCGLVWLDAGGARWIVTLALSTIVCPFFARRSLIEASLRLRTQGSALERFYLDALIGAQPVRVHGAEQAVRREHEALLVEWARSARGLLTRSTGLQALQLLASAVPAVALVGHFAWSEQSPAAILLVAFWALRMPIAASELVNALL